MKTPASSLAWKDWNTADACAWVASRARHVSINHEKIPSYTAWLLAQYPLVTTLDPETHHIGTTPEETARYVLALDSINFGSGYFKGIEGFGYAEVARGLKSAFIQGALGEPRQWAGVSVSLLKKYFPAPEKLLEQFALHLHFNGKKIISQYNGRILDFITSCGHSATDIVTTLAGWQSFSDTALYEGQNIPFLKRAQIFAADLNLALPELGLKDINALTCFADNMVPHVLRSEGLIAYDESLAEKIDAGVALVSGSREEVEIRAAAVHAVELIKECSPAGITAVNIDHLLWHRGHEPSLYGKPAHVCITTAY